MFPSLTLPLCPPPVTLYVPPLTLSLCPYFVTFSIYLTGFDFVLFYDGLVLCRMAAEQPQVMANYTVCIRYTGDQCSMKSRQRLTYREGVL
jgi:hypothetical protein